ncbi:hypothetical protein FQN57_003308 [Myotisia sp. PD_48]|nr:hypothetical protein FQN57_003308 [Myotisia sp. PD_48]
MSTKDLPIARDDDDNDALLAALDAEEDDAQYRANRIKQLQSELRDQAPTATTSNGTDGVVTTLLNHSSYPTLPTDQSLLDFTTQITRCVIHFFHPDFARCDIMDKHLTRLSEAHGGGTTRFARVDARNVPFIVEKLKIRTLPCVLAFVDGAVADRILGFEGLVDPARLLLSAGTADGGFKTNVLEDRLVGCGVLAGRRVAVDEEEEEERERLVAMMREKSKGIRTGKTMRRSGNEDEDSDWD